MRVNGAQEKGRSTGEPMPARYGAITLAFALGMSAAVLLGQGTQTLPDAIKADSKTYSVEFENDVVRVLRVRLAPGVSTMVLARNWSSTCSLAPVTSGTSTSLVIAR